MKNFGSKRPRDRLPSEGWVCVPASREGLIVLLEAILHERAQFIAKRILNVDTMDFLEHPYTQR